MCRFEQKTSRRRRDIIYLQATVFAQIYTLRLPGKKTLDPLPPEVHARELNNLSEQQSKRLKPALSLKEDDGRTLIFDAIEAAERTPEASAPEQPAAAPFESTRPRASGCAAPSPPRMQSWSTHTRRRGERATTRNHDARSAGRA